MVRVSNTVVALLNVIFLLVSLAVIAGGVYIHLHASATTCQKSLRNSLVILGVFLLLVSFLGLVGSCCRNNCLFWLYLILLFFMFVGLLVFTTFAFFVTNEDAGKALSGRGFKEHRLGDYSHWLQNHFVKGKNWDVLRSCLIEAKVCKAFTDDNNQNDFLKKKFSPMEAGCCKPPAECRFQYRNGTKWTAAKSGPEVDDSDCHHFPVDVFFCFICYGDWVAAYLALTFVVTNEGAGKALSGLGFKEYRLGDYSNWLRNHFEQGKNWDEIRSCLVDAQVCRSLGLDVYQEASDFYKQQFSPVQSGCCKPPRYCGFEFKNATFWIMPKSGPSVEDSDCTTWSNTQDKLCYDCKSCKRGVLDNIKNEWRSLAVMNFCLLAFVVLVYSTSCCTRRNLGQSKYYKDYYP
ncbi:hypothetical protein GH714_029605 [Hevea brasiliensis]|uniref:Uncharacterized protein n=1 Tax=Hevea brasiliensis TaxID=3981 RepID=A0A6A6NJT1_HEVBR|nr:hypothetical protein GH714_029605 [Hevea brasiliensis]